MTNSPDIKMTVIHHLVRIDEARSGVDQLVIPGNATKDQQIAAVNRVLASKKVANSIRPVADMVEVEGIVNVETVIGTGDTAKEAAFDYLKQVETLVLLSYLDAVFARMLNDLDRCDLDDDAYGCISDLPVGERYKWLECYGFAGQHEPLKSVWVATSFGEKYEYEDETWKGACKKLISDLRVKLPDVNFAWLKGR